MYNYAKSVYKPANSLTFDNTHLFKLNNKMSSSSLSSFGKGIELTKLAGYCIKNNRIVKVYSARGKGNARYYHNKTKVPKGKRCYPTAAKARAACANCSSSSSRKSKPRKRKKSTKKRKRSYSPRKKKLKLIVLRRIPWRLVPRNRPIINLRPVPQNCSCSGKSLGSCMATPGCYWANGRCICSSSSSNFGQSSVATNYQLYQQGNNSGTPTAKQLYSIGDGNIYVPENNLSGYGV